MKVKIISNMSLEIVEQEVNDFIKDKEVIEIKIIEDYDFVQDLGFVTYHIMYK